MLVDHVEDAEVREQSHILSNYITFVDFVFTFVLFPHAFEFLSFQ